MREGGREAGREREREGRITEGGGGNRKRRVHTQYIDYDVQ